MGVAHTQRKKNKTKNKNGNRKNIAKSKIMKKFSKSGYDEIIQLRKLNIFALTFCRNCAAFLTNFYYSFSFYFRHFTKHLLLCWKHMHLIYKHFSTQFFFNKFFFFFFYKKNFFFFTFFFFLLKFLFFRKTLIFKLT